MPRKPKQIVHNKKLINATPKIQAESSSKLKSAGSQLKMFTIFSSGIKTLGLVSCIVTNIFSFFK